MRKFAVNLCLFSIFTVLFQINLCDYIEQSIGLFKVSTLHQGIKNQIKSNGLEGYFTVKISY